MTNSNEKVLHKELSYKIQGLIFNIRNELGSGYKESIYQKALEKELTNSGVKFSKEPAIKVYSKKGEFLGLYRPDFLIEDKIIIELKAVTFISSQESARVYDYLRNSEYELAYLINFTSSKLYIKRLILTNDRKRKTVTKLAVFVAISFLFVAISGLPSAARAAEIFFGSQGKDVGLNSNFEIGVFVDSQNESINAIESKITFPGDYLSLQGAYTGNSILTFWVDQPNSPSNGTVSFSGVVPGGYVGSKGYLFSLIFKALKEGKVEIKTSQEKILLNDGQGTAAKTLQAPLSLNLKEGGPDLGFVPLQDATPPESFQPQVGNDPNILGGKYFVAFSAQDKGSGVDYYEVMEAPQFGSFRSLFSSEDWSRAQSPYLLKNQTLKSDIYVAAFDKLGNKRVVKSKASHYLPLYENYLFWCTIIIIGVLIRLVPK